MASAPTDRCAGDPGRPPPLDGLSVAFVHPPLDLPPNFVNYPLFASLGLLYAAARVERLGARVQVVDALLGKPDGPLPLRVGPRGARLGLSPRATAALVEGAPDVVVVGASMFAHPGRLAASRIPALLAALDGRRPTAALVLADLHAGGIDYLPWDACAALRAEPRLTAVSQGEGESSLPDLLAALAGRRPFAGLPRAAWRERGRPRRGSYPGPLIADLDDAEPAFHLVDVERFFRLQEEGAGLDLIHEYPRVGRCLPFLTSRGCPFGCSFCAKAFGNRRRQASAASVLARTKALRDRYDVERFFFLDDCINADPRRFEGIARGLADAGIAWEAPNGFRADRLSAAAVRDMARAGLTVPSISAESADPDVLRRIVGKSLDPAAVPRAAALLAAAGFRPRVHFIIGFPGETRAQINRTVEAAAAWFERFGAEPRLQFATPLPGTALYRRARAARALCRDTAALEVGGLFTGGSVVRTAAFGPGELARFAAALARRIDLARHPKVLLAPSYRCNSRCVFCCTDTLPKRDAPWDDLVARLRDARGRGVRLLDIDGGEPTLYERLPDLIEEAKRLGFERVTLVTNARRAAYAAYARELRARGLDAAAVTLLGSGPAAHDALAGAPGAFVEAVRGAEHLADAGVELHGNLVLLPDNLGDVGAAARLLLRLGADRVNLQYPLPLGPAARPGFRFPAPAAVRRAVEAAAAESGAERFEVHNLAPCLVPGIGPRVAFAGFKTVVEMVFAHGTRANFGRMIARLAAHVPECAGCTDRVACGGVWRHLLRAGIRPGRTFAGLRVPRTGDDVRSCRRR
jgi:MoaA/NifB/PqqE/SkfB family radical SAM enzyme